MRHPRHLFLLFSSFQTNIAIFTANAIWGKIHPVYGAGIQTHNLQHMIHIRCINTASGLSAAATYLQQKSVAVSLPDSPSSTKRLWHCAMMRIVILD